MISRLVPVLLIKEGSLYKSCQFSDMTYIGDPINAVRIFNDKEVDEIIVLDITASKNRLEPDLELISRITSEAFMPLSYGGGIVTLEHAKSLFNIGVEKLVFNNILQDNDSLVRDVIAFAGTSSVIASIDVKLSKGQREVYSHVYGKVLNIDPIELATSLEKLGVGEIFLNSVDRDGMMQGYDLELIREISNKLTIPLIACGGAGTLQHFRQAYLSGASALAAGSFFVYKGRLKAVLPNYPSQDDIIKIFENAPIDMNINQTSETKKFNSMKTAQPMGKECIRCVMNTTVDPTITFDDQGLCSHCIAFDKKVNIRLARNFSDPFTVEKLVSKIKASSRHSEYDCLIGVSGGVDSSYVAYLVRKLGLKPLAVHFDNGWNSELAVKNIESLLDKLEIDLITHVVDWNEFRNLQKSFLEASTPDGEIPSDHGIFATMWRTADKYNIKYIISGMNYHTESMSIPGWSYGHSDWKYIKAVHDKFSNTPLHTYPHFSPWYIFYLTFIRRIKTVSILNYIPYNKEDAVQLLKEEFGWTAYGGKHHESIYTRFYQGYFLPQKFGIDKRYCHYSDSINTGQMSREQAKEFLLHPTYDPALQESDLEYIKSKFQISDHDFEAIIQRAPQTYDDYPNNYRLIELMKKSVHFFRRLNIYPK